MTKLKEYKIHLETVDLGLKYFGFRWWHLFFANKRTLIRGYGKFDLIIDLQTKFRNTLILSRIPHSSLYSRTFNGFFSSNRQGSTYSNSEYCCNDIYSFKYSSTIISNSLSPEINNTT